MNETKVQIDLDVAKNMFRDMESYSDARERALMARNIVEYIRTPYEQYIESLLAKIKFMQANSEMILANQLIILSELKEIKASMK